MELLSTIVPKILAETLLFQLTEIGCREEKKVDLAHLFPQFLKLVFLLFLLCIQEGYRHQTSRKIVLESQFYSGEKVSRPLFKQKRTKKKKNFSCNISFFSEL
jgi:hypothetical protein